MGTPYRRYFDAINDLVLDWEPGHKLEFRLNGDLYLVESINKDPHYYQSPNYFGIVLTIIRTANLPVGGLGHQGFEYSARSYAATKLFNVLRDQTVHHRV